MVVDVHMSMFDFEHTAESLTSDGRWKSAVIGEVLGTAEVGWGLGEEQQAPVLPARVVGSVLSSLVMSAAEIQLLNGFPIF